jgi:hypothetical protein
LFVSTLSWFKRSGGGARILVHTSIRTRLYKKVLALRCVHKEPSPHLSIKVDADVSIPVELEC